MAEDTSAKDTLKAFGILILLHVSAFGPMFWGKREFVRWDDEELFQKVDFWKGLSREHIISDFESTVGAVYEPFAWILKGVVYTIAGDENPWFFGLASAVLHTAGTLLLFISLIYISPRLESRYLTDRQKSEVGGSARAAAKVLALGIYGVHPLRVEVVAWCSCQAYALAGFFAAAMLLCHVRCRLALLPSDVARGSTRAAVCWASLMVLLYASSLLSKSAAVPLLLLCAVLDVLLFPELLPLFSRSQPLPVADPQALSQQTARAEHAQRGQQQKPTQRRETPTQESNTKDSDCTAQCIVVLSYIGCLIALGIVLPRILAANATHVEIEVPVHNDGEGMRPEQRLANAAIQPLRYVQQTALPFKIPPRYTLPLEIDPTRMPHVVRIILLGGLSIAAACTQAKNPARILDFPLLWGSYLLLLLPSLGIMKHGYDNAGADR
ncbi:hypothetical protein CYMTET_31894, partial [Cymbomonas tetramitiformis]